VLPVAQPVIMAKALATIDWMSSGRISATFGVGWDETEYYELLGPVLSRDRGPAAPMSTWRRMIELWDLGPAELPGRVRLLLRRGLSSPSRCRSTTCRSGSAARPLGTSADGPITDRRLVDALPSARRSNWPARLTTLRSQPGYREPFEVSFSLSTASIGYGHVLLDNPDARPNGSAEYWADRIGRLQDVGVTITSVPVPPRCAGPDELLDFAQWDDWRKVKPRSAIAALAKGA